MFSYYWSNTSFIKRSFYKYFKNDGPRYLFNMIPTTNPSYITRNYGYIPLFITKYSFFKTLFLQSTIIGLNNLDPNLRNSDTYENFKNLTLRFLRPSPNILFKCHSPQRITFLVKLCLGLSHLLEHLSIVFKIVEYIMHM